MQIKPMPILLLCLLALTASPVTAAGPCDRLQGYWQPLFQETWDRFPESRSFLSLEKREFTQALLEAQRFHFDCPSMRFQPSQGKVLMDPMSFSVESSGKDTMVVAAPARSSRRFSITFRGDGLAEFVLGNERYVARPAKPYAPAEEMVRSRDLIPPLQFKD